MKKKQRKSGFEKLYYRGIPIELRSECSANTIYFVSGSKPDNEKVIWAMRCMANDIEGKKTWFWGKFIWKIRRWLK